MKPTRTSRWTYPVLLAVAALALASALTVAACGGAGTPASQSSAAPAATPSPTVTPAAEPISRWDAPGSATAAQTLALTRRYATALQAEKIPVAGLYTARMTWDYQPADAHVRGAKEHQRDMKDAGTYLDWSGPSHLLVTSGAGVWEGVTTSDMVNPLVRTPSLSLIAVNGNKIVHEEIFLNEGVARPVDFGSSTPGPKDTAKVAARVSRAVSDAFAAGDQAAMRPLIAPDVLFRDTALRRGATGWDGLVAWWDKVPELVLDSKEPVAGPGWAVQRWTVYRTYPTGVQLALPGATVMEVRDGKVARMTIYYNSQTVSLQM